MDFTEQQLIRLRLMEEAREDYHRRMLAAHTGEAEFPKLRSVNKELDFGDRDDWFVILLMLQDVTLILQNY